MTIPSVPIMYMVPHLINWYYILKAFTDTWLNKPTIHYTNFVNVQ